MLFSVFHIRIKVDFRGDEAIHDQLSIGRHVSGIDESLTIEVRNQVSVDIDLEVLREGKRHFLVMDVVADKFAVEVGNRNELSREIIYGMVNEGHGKSLLPCPGQEGCSVT